MKARIDSLLRHLGRESGRTFAVGAGSVFLLKIVGAFLMLLGQIIAARLLGPAEYGYFAYAQSVLLIVTVFTILGYDNSLLRFVPEYRVNRQWPMLKGVLTFSFKRSLLASVIAAALGAILLTLDKPHFAAGQRDALQIMLLCVPLYTLTMVRQAALRGFRHVVLAEFPESLVRPLLFIPLLMLVSQMRPLTAVTAWWIYFLVVLVAFFFGSWMLIRILPGELHQVNAEHKATEWRSISLDMMWMNAMNIVFNQAAVVLLGFFSPPEEVALFSAAARIAFFVSFALFAVNSIAAPLISEFYYGGRMRELERIMTLSAALLAATTLFADLFLLAFGKSVLGAFGAPFRKAFGILLLLMIGHTVKSFSGPASYLLNMSGRQRLTRRMMAVFVFLHLLAGVLIINRFGAFGAAVVSAATLSFWNLALAAAAYKVVGLDSTFFTLIRFKKVFSGA
ncbi:MAG: oligosaccharide flippase family protein [candidate division KSB1 bacterium]|nr:oligosaccharide flippase family protein [candidate division KSB1 bacterium]